MSAASGDMPAHCAYIKPASYGLSHFGALSGHCLRQSVQMAAEVVALSVVDCEGIGADKNIVNIETNVLRCKIPIFQLIRKI